jgi:hypothetical protein
VAAVDHEGRHLAEELAHQVRDIWRQRRFLQRSFHQRHPAVAGALIDRKRHVAHAQARVTALLDVARRPAEAANEKIAQSLFGPGQILWRVHRAQHVVVRHLGIEGTDQPAEPLLTDPCVDLFFRQIHNSSMTDEAPKTAYELAMERLRRKDAEDGIEEREVSKELKAEIAEIKRVYAAKIAEAEILHKSKIMALMDPEQRALAEQGHRRDLERLRDDQERKLAKLRG